MPRPKVGDRVRITGVMNDPDPLPVGLEGTVIEVTPPHYAFQQYTVDWSPSGRTLMLLPDDPFCVL